jgi:FtsH-binding integral membrane protein
MTTPTELPPPGPVKRPALVWVISIFYFLSAGWTILSFLLILSGAFPMNEAQKEYFQSQSPVDYGSTFLIGTANLVGAVLLLLLKKPAFHLFATAFAVGLVLTGYQIFTKNWLGAIGGPGLIGAIIGWGISIAVIVYAKRLIDRGVLK